ncbi:low temperature requirement protein A [Novosphingobium album (ex Liu et al. 2023)]|uniref:Low temperature requirement protein A n=1 Tax=Novosphingobium album (ex Liu et al. 2023) TaxID=3031130 RepID=A0ABT5WSN3_9SPHN|nr:low temperature requirement protein A [Novosphingobium album (ex Liu et al. 2023)]MDE8653010.1 low temperature requirement protein A [Novosphingobium album (ex Liu et al. 2023)]
MSPRTRDPHEEHRASTPLELLFDLVIVIAIASAAAGLHHAVAGNHAGQGVLTFALAFFATWWAWVNFTWFASAYDNDGPVYRLITCWIMGGALVLAAGIPAMFEGIDLSLVIIGYIVMRIGMVAFWLITARSDPPHRKTAMAYAAGIALAQVYWTVALLLLRPEGQGAVVALFLIGVALELSVPAVAERQGITPWHREHMIERHGLFIIIVLGEVLLSGATAFELGGEGHGDLPRLVLLAVSALTITFAMWWLYFSQEGPLESDDLGSAIRWGYLHSVIYAAGAAVGAGFLVLVDVLRGHAAASQQLGNLAVAVPLAAYLGGIWLVRDRAVLIGTGRHVLLPFAVAVLAAGTWLGQAALPAMALLCALAVPVRGHVRCQSA